MHVATAPCLYADRLTSSLETIQPGCVILTTQFVNDTESSHTCYLFKVKQYKVCSQRQSTQKLLNFQSLL